MTKLIILVNNEEVVLNKILEYKVLELKGLVRPGYIKKDDVGYCIYNFHGDFKSNLINKEFKELLELGIIEQLSNTKWVLSGEVDFIIEDV